MRRLFQARMWREYAQAWDGKRTSTGVGREWVAGILRVPRSECLRIARAALRGVGGTAGLVSAIPSSVETFHDYETYERAKCAEQGYGVRTIYRGREDSVP